MGRSGAGKSSLLQAGLLPAIKAGRLDVPGSRHWPQVVMTPGRHPMEVLTRRLSAGTAPEGLIVCVDQFEEVFTACPDETERRAFIQALCAAAAGDGTPRVQVILGLRADFYGRCLDYPELAPMVAAGQVPVRPMSREELRSAIEDPADAAGLRLEEGLAGRLLRDLESAEGPGREADTALPLLAFALQATWQQSDKRTLTLSDYEATGGIWGAVTQRAEAVYESLGPSRDSARLLLLSMVQLGDGTDDVRRRVSVTDLLAGRPAAEQTGIRGALDAYVGARLVTVDDDTAEIAHEALLRAWDRLRRWIEEDRQELLDHQRLAEAARVWKQSGGPLYVGARLDDVRTWLDEEQPLTRRSLSPLERDFVEASVRAARRRRNRRWSFAGTAIVAVLLLVIGGFYTVRQRAGNQGSQAVESSIALAQAADNLRATDPAAAMWLSLAAYDSSKTSQARTALYKSLTSPSDTPVTGLSPQTDSTWLPIAFSPDGHVVAIGDGDGRFRIWNTADPAHPALIATVAASSQELNAVAFSPDGNALAVANENSTSTAQSSQVGLWDVRDLARPALRSVLTVNSALSVAFSPVGHLLVSGGVNDDVQGWNVADISKPVKAQVSGDDDNGQTLYSVAFHPGSESFVAADSGGKTEIWSQSARRARGSAIPVRAS